MVVQEINFQSCLNSRLLILALIPITISIGLVYQIALQSGYNVHPDEYAHLDAICYFRDHWWPPDLNTDGIVYSGYGWSRLYDGELVYLLYGKLIRAYEVAETQLSASISQPQGTGNTELACGDLITAFIRYRPLNVWLYLFTMLGLVALSRKHLWPLLIALLVLCLPQVNYVYSYANSDAWGLSMSIFLFVYILIRRTNLFYSWPDLLVLSILTALVILSKKTFWVSIPFAYLLIGLEAYSSWKINRAVLLRLVLIRMLVLITLTVAWVAPLRIYYPLSQGNFSEKEREMRETRASPEFKPSNPSNTGYLMAERGYPFWSAATMLWFKQSAGSFYGLFGYMTERLPQWLYTLVYGLLFILAACTSITLFFQRNTLPLVEKWMLISAPAFVLIAVLASLYNSWTFDFQPQGRYLFAALIPLALVEGGLVCFESRRVRFLRLVTWLVLYGICLAVLVIFVLGNETLVPR